MSVQIENKIISALTGPKTLAEIAERIGEREYAVLTVLSNLLMEGTVKRGGKLFWLAARP